MKAANEGAGGPRRREVSQLGRRAGPDTQGWEITDFLTYRIDLLHRLQIRQTKRMLAETFGLSLAEWRVLCNLARRAPDSIGAIAGRTEVAKSQISRAAATLEDRGYVARAQNPEDARTPLFSLTSSGRRLHAKVMDIGRERQRRLLAGLDPEQRRVLYEAIDILTVHLRGDA